jgi:hypothetical protein
MAYGLLADLLVAVHMAFAVFIVAGQLLIWAGLIRRWSWVRNPWFRLAHLAAIVLVGLEAVFGVACPITVWEDQLREAAGQEITGETFIGRWIHYLLFYDVDSAILNGCHILFAILVIATFVFAPPCWRRAGGKG